MSKQPKTYCTICSAEIEFGTVCDLCLSKIYHDVDVPKDPDRDRSATWEEDYNDYMDEIERRQRKS